MLQTGLRLGEVVHFSKHWVNFDRRTLGIPPHEPCDCNYCLDRIKAQLKTMKIPVEKRNPIAIEKVKNYYWQPKTEAGVRVVFYGLFSDYEKILEEFFANYNQWPNSYFTAYRRIRKLLDLAGLESHVPHHLRKTGGTNYAARGLSEHQLMDVMGWDDSSIARDYIRLHGLRSVEAQMNLLDTEQKTGFILDSRFMFYLTASGREMVIRIKKRDEEEWLRSLLFSDQNNQNKCQKSLSEFY
jgi:integrase